jgi:hypothetical protein
MADNPVFAQGTVCRFNKYQPDGTITGTGTKFVSLKGISAGAMTRTISDTTTIESTQIKRRPARMDPGTVTLTLGLVDKIAAQNEFTVLKDAFTAGSMLKIEIDLAGTWDDALPGPPAVDGLFTFSGFISSLSTPPIDSKSDNQLEYEVIIQRTEF